MSSLPEKLGSLFGLQRKCLLPGFLNQMVYAIVAQKSVETYVSAMQNASPRMPSKIFCTQSLVSSSSSFTSFQV